MSPNRTPNGVESNWPDLSDAEWAARQAELALKDGRYRLAASFAALADRAQQQARAEIVDVPMRGTTRDEAPAGSAHGAPDFRPEDYRTPIADQLAETNVIPFAQGQGPTGNGDADLAAAAAEAKTEIFGQVKGATDGAVPQPRRCQASVLRDGVNDVCGGGIHIVGWQQNNDVPVWSHVDHRLDANHQAWPGSNWSAS